MKRPSWIPEDVKNEYPWQDLENQQINNINPELFAWAEQQERKERREDNGD